MKPDEVEELANRASAAFRAGKIPDARRMVAEALAAEATSADATSAEAARAEATRAEARYVQALLLQRDSQWPAAMEIALALATAYPQKLKYVCLLADLRQLTRQHAYAQQLYTHVLQRMPGYPDAIYGLGCLAASQNKITDAIPLFRQAVTASPKRSDFATALAQALQAVNQPAPADQVLDAALKQLPGHPDLLEKLGTLRGQSGRLSEAEFLLREAVANDPDHISASLNLSVCLYLQRRLQEALDVVLKPLERHPDSDSLNARAGQMLYELGESERALPYLDRSLAANPSQVQPYCTRGLVLLCLGRWHEGWPLYEWRYRDPNFPQRPPQVDFPRWKGEPLEGKSITIWPEQGNGDHIQYIRFAKWFKERGATVTVRCWTSLTNLLATCPFPDKIVPVDVPPVATDYYVPMMSMPGALDLGPEDVACPTPYLSAPAEFRGKLSEEITPHAGKKKIGIVWAGAAGNARDYQRSTRLKDWLPLRDVRDDVVFFSLQKDNAAMQLNDLRSQWPIIDLGRRSHSWAETAGIIEQLDLIICVDTAVAHLAGALGKPVWMLISRAHDFRWLNAGQTTAWYPTMRLFRQSKAGQWSKVIQDVATALQALT